ncbi:MAG: hypothetical protein Satyrvirus2_59 [Satyrvirus sp.]|uniref:Uncharacterized protein n=1 Tax=Satyrvirus sp. TaxID=2487771 RepID=A0A3G5ACU2_9VIRU|nr:MAG: hypothetical protein Satyrvirus2_59 [Satyrvirus sp.]
MNKFLKLGNTIYNPKYTREIYIASEDYVIEYVTMDTFIKIGKNIYNTKYIKEIICDSAGCVMKIENDSDMICTYSANCVMAKANCETSYTYQKGSLEYKTLYDLIHGQQKN